MSDKANLLDIVGSGGVGRFAHYMVDKSAAMGWSCSLTNAAANSGTLLQIPSWVTSARSDVPEDVAFLSGAVLSHLHLVLGVEALPQVLLRQRLALRAVAACVRHAGYPEGVAELRDAVACLHPGDSPDQRAWFI